MSEQLDQSTREEDLLVNQALDIWSKEIESQVGRSLLPTRIELLTSVQTKLREQELTILDTGLPIPGRKSGLITRFIRSVWQKLQR